MFKTSGYFKGVPCPYHGSGLCERPYCHFGHFKSEQEENNGGSEKISVIENSSVSTSTFQKLDKVKWYKPTPIPKLINRAHKQKFIKQDIPEYKPTPLHLLTGSGSNDITSSSKKKLVDYTRKVPRKKTNVVAPQVKVVELVDTVLKPCEIKTKEKSVSSLDNVTSEAEQLPKEHIDDIVSDSKKCDQIKNSCHENIGKNITNELKSTVDAKHDNTEVKITGSSEEKCCDKEEKPVIVSESDSVDLLASEDKCNQDTAEITSVNQKDGTETSPPIKEKEKSNSKHEHCCCCHGDIKYLKNKKHKSSHSSHHKSSHKKKSKKKSSQKRKKKKKHKYSDKKKHHSSSSEYDSSSDSSEDEQLNKGQTHSKRESRNSKDSDHGHKKIKSHHRSSSVSSSSSRSRSKTNHSKAKRKESTSKHPKKRHSSSRSGSSSHEHKKKLKRSNSKNKEKTGSKRRNSRSLSSHEGEHKRRKSSTDIKDKSSEVPPKVHKNIFDSLITVTASVLQSTRSDGTTIQESKDTIDLTHTATSSSTDTEKPTFKKSVSKVALFGDDSDEDVKKVQPVIPQKTVIVVPSTKPTIKTAESDSDSIILSSDSELNNVPKNVKPEFPTVELDDIDLSDADPFDECLQIFNESKNDKVESSIPKEKEVPVDISIGQSNDIGFGKKREAYKQISAKSSTQQRVEAQRHAPRPSASQVMHKRLLAVQQKSQEDQKPSQTKPQAKRSLLDPFAKKSRVAHTPNPLSQSKNTGKLQKKNESPKKKSAKRPIIPTEFGSKVPTNVRQQYLNKMIDDCLKIYTEEQDAYDRGLSEEKAVYERSNNKAIYMRVAVNAIKKLRDECAVKTNTGSSNRLVSHSAVLGGHKATVTKFTLNRTGKSPHKFSIEIFVRHLLENYILTDAQLEENRFPRPDPDKPGHALVIVEEKFKGALTSDVYERQCIRCGKSFRVGPTGSYVRTEQCIYHWGKAWKRKIAGVWDNKWTCCGGDLGAKGCQVCTEHVHEHNKAHNTEGFVKTLPSSSQLDWNCHVYALDCEMVYTVSGLELARVTVVDFNCETVLEKLVKPPGTVIDYNTRFSGLTEASMKGVKTTLRDIQAILLSLFSEKTILVGHSLESDLMALKMIHQNVVDTSVVFPHKMGPPYKRGLKTLMGEILQKIIQEDVDGHDSLEDASAAMELMIWKVKDDLKHSRVKIR